MAIRLGRLQPNVTDVYDVQGESTPSTPLPTKFISTTPATSPISSQNNPPAGFTPWGPLAVPVVQRAERMVGMRYLNAKGHITMPILRLGADGPPNPWDSAFNKELHGPIHYAGFNDALFQAGYPGWNLGLSFKVPTLPQNGRGSSSQTTVPTRSMQRLKGKTEKLIRTRRATGQPRGT